VQQGGGTFPTSSLVPRPPAWISRVSQRSPPLPLGSAVTFDYRATTLQPRRRSTLTDALIAGPTHGVLPATSRDRLALRMAGTCPAMTVEQTLRWQFHRMVVPHTGSVTAFGVPTTARSVAIKDESSICSPPLPLGSAVTFDYRATTLQPRRRFTVTDALMAGLTHGLVPATSRDRLALRMAGTCPAMTVEQRSAGNFTVWWCRTRAQWLRLAFRPRLVPLPSKT
jgi:hypothetical protein